MNEAIITQDISKIPQLLLASAAVYYEWDASKHSWEKMLDADPEPPSDIPDGKYDGQIVEIRQEIKQ